MKGKTLSSVLRSALKYQPPSSAAGKFVHPHGAVSPHIRGSNLGDSLGNKVTHERKRLYFPKNLGFDAELLVRRCAYTLGTTPGIQVFDGSRIEHIKECNALIKGCIQRARISTDERGSARHMRLAFDIFNSMTRRSFPPEEETYGPLVEYLIDTRMTGDFCCFRQVIEKENPSSHSRLRYYTMLLLIRVRDDKEIQRLCDTLVRDGDTKSISQHSREWLLLALCESERTKELVQLLESMDITKFTSLDVVAHIFKYLGRFLLESFVEKVLLEFKACDADCATGNTSNMIYSYVLGIPNLMVEDVISNFKNMHRKLELTPSSVSYEKLIIFCCDSLKVHVALELVNEMIELGLTFSLETLHSILQASSENCDFNLVHQIRSVISQGKLKPNSKTFRSMIDLCGKVKDEKEYIPSLLAEKAIFQKSFHAK